MMDGLSRAWPELDRLHPFIFRKVQRDGEVAVDVHAGSRQFVRIGHRQDHVRLSQLPAFGELGQSGELGRIAFGHTSVHPLFDRGDLFVGKPVHADKISISRRGVPGRHITGLGDGGDESSALFYVLIGRKGEGGGLARSMARHAIVEYDWSDLLREGELC